MHGAVRLIQSELYAVFIQRFEDGIQIGCVGRPFGRPDDMLLSDDHHSIFHAALKHIPLRLVRDAFIALSAVI